MVPRVPEADVTRTYLGGRIVASRRFALLAGGDLLALLVFAGASALRHGGTLVSMAETTVEFGLGWLLVALLAGAYGARALENSKRAAVIGAGAWAGGAVVGAVIRVAVEPFASLAPVFVLVTAGVGAVIFGAWRAVAARLL